MSTPVRRGDAWDPIWSGSSYARADRRAARARVKVAALAALRFEAGEGDRVLDLGCGSGHNTVEIAARTRARARWIACDRSAVATRAARTTFDGAGLDAAVLAADAVHLPFRTSSIDAVLAFMVLHHLPRSDDALAEIDRVLADGGRLGVVVPGRWSLASATSAVRKAAGLWPYDQRTYTARALRAELEMRFEIQAVRAFHLGFDRPVTARADRALGAAIPAWGRYLVALCGKRARR
jgi:SAM-dependent methyltransferase